MKKKFTYFFICFFVLMNLFLWSSYAQTISIFKNEIILPEQKHLPIFQDEITPELIVNFIEKLERSSLNSTAQSLNRYKLQNDLAYWMYYQIVRRAAQYYAPKEKNYEQYTILKWYFMYASGYDVRLAVIEGKLLFYTKSDEEVFNIPFFDWNGHQYICLNRHDYGVIDFESHALLMVPTSEKGNQKSFSYKISELPDFTEDQYIDKDIVFYHADQEYKFKIKLNKSVDTLFVNYPITDYASYFNIPLSEGTKKTLMEKLSKILKNKTTSEGIDYLLDFTRSAFSYENDQKNFGTEKRLSPEQTLLQKHSDCDDRVALFYCLVKEFYNLPMIAIVYPTHINIAVKIDGVNGDYITYNNEKYLICEPTPQSQRLQLGQQNPKMKHLPYEVVYAYHPE